MTLTDVYCRINRARGMEVGFCLFHRLSNNGIFSVFQDWKKTLMVLKVLFFSFHLTNKFTEMSTEKKIFGLKRQRTTGQPVKGYCEGCISIVLVTFEDWSK